MGNTKLANPLALGLMGFGMTTISLNLHNIRMFPMDGIITAMGVLRRYRAQIASQACWNNKKTNTFGNNHHLLRFLLADHSRHSADA